jgi:uncharacterized protein (TIGR02996 family)
MTDSEWFDRAIRDNVNDDDLRLAYADWLEERGDIRGEYLRLECLLKSIPARLTQLREKIDPTWLAAVSKRWLVLLVRFPPERKISTIKIVKEVTGLGLNEAVRLVEFVREESRSVIKDHLLIAEAAEIAKKFEGIAVVSIEHSETLKQSGSVFRTADR